jgi:hypothetical protein
MNVGYFYISGSAVGTGTDIPFSVKAWRRASTSTSNNDNEESALLLQKTRDEAA